MEVELVKAYSMTTLSNLEMLMLDTRTWFPEGSKVHEQMERVVELFSEVDVAIQNKVRP